MNLSHHTATLLGLLFPISPVCFVGPDGECDSVPGSEIVSLLAPARMNRTTNVVVSLTYVASVVVSTVGETWSYFILGSVVEVMLLLAIARVAGPGRART